MFSIRYLSSLDEKVAPRHSLGLDAEYVRELVDYWRTKFDWKQRIEHLNKHEQFKAHFDDVTVHYVRIKPTQQESRVSSPSIPLLLVDGWPGCFSYFYKMVDHLREAHANVPLDITIVQIPGFAYSSPLTRPIDVSDATLYFDALMKHLHGEKVTFSGRVRQIQISTG